MGLEKASIPTFCDRRFTTLSCLDPTHARAIFFKGGGGAGAWLGAELSFGVVSKRGAVSPAVFFVKHPKRVPTPRE